MLDAPQYILYAEADEDDGMSPGGGRWRFILESAENGERIEASDIEPELRGERLEVLSVVRGLEALEKPSRVTLITSSRYVRLGLAFGLEQWRADHWHWERFGRIVPIKNADLWQRVDRALRIHKLECRVWRIDGAHKRFVKELPPPPESAARIQRAEGRAGSAAGSMMFAKKHDCLPAPHVRSRVREAIAQCFARWRVSLAK
jgi:ribonuclease HI